MIECYSTDYPTTISTEEIGQRRKKNIIGPDGHNIGWPTKKEVDIGIKQRLINCRLIQIIQFLAQNPSAGGRFCLIEKKNELKQKQDWESIQSLYSQSCYPSK